MLTDEKREIDGVTFHVHQMPCEQQEDLLIDLFKLLGPTLASAVGSLLAGKTAGSVKSIQDVKLTPEMFASAVRELGASLEKERYHAICKALSGVTKVNLGEEGKWPLLKSVESELFKGRLPLKWKWLAFAMEVQFGFFFSWSDVLQGAARAMAKGEAA